MAGPLLVAVSGSVQQLARLLRCLGFAASAQVQLSPEGVRFSAEDSRVMQGLAFLDRSIFASYRYDDSSAPSDSNDDDSSSTAEHEHPTFQISLSALLETLSIFGATELSKDRFGRDAYVSGIGNARQGGGGSSMAFDNRTLGLSGVCRISYDGPGAPLNITLEEGNLTTTCSLTTYEPGVAEDIPFDRETLALKIIMRSALLFDAVQELASTSPDRLRLACNPTGRAGGGVVSFATVGDFGSARVEFADEAHLLETFQCAGRCVNAYKFSQVRAAAKAMAAASKVSVRVDCHGVLSLQFMIELAEAEGKVSFVDFRFLPLELDDGDGAGDDDDDDAGGEPQDYD